MNTLSNVINNIIFAVFFTFIGALFASSLVLWFYADQKILSVLSFALFAVLCFITFSLSNIRFKSDITELAVSIFKTLFSIALGLFGCFTTQLTYHLAVFNDSSYSVLCFISLLFVLSQMLSVYINLSYSLKLIKYVSSLYKADE